MWQFDGCNVPWIKTELPGPKGKKLLQRDERYLSPSYTRAYPLVVERGSGAVIEDVDGNLFLDFTAGIAVVATGHCHPEVVAAIQNQAAKLIHMSGTDFYYQPEIDLAQRLAELAPGKSPKRVFFTNSGAEALEAALKLARWHTGRSRAIAFLGAFHGRTYGAMSLSGSKLVHRRGFSPLVPDIHHVPYPRGPEARTVRMLAEYLEPKARFLKLGVSQAIIFWGSARLQPGHRTGPARADYYAAARELAGRLARCHACVRAIARGRALARCNIAPDWC